VTPCNIIVNAVNALRDGLDVVIVAHPASRAFDMADTVVAEAAARSIPCTLSEQRNGPERYEPIPLVMIRPFGWVVEDMWPFRPRPVVLIDQSAVFERTNCAPPRVRTVEAL